MIVKSVDHLRQLPAFVEGWKNAGPGLLNFLNERALSLTRTGNAQAAQAIALLLEELRGVAITDDAPTRPHMKPLKTL